MTLLNGLLTPDAAYVWTDTAAYSLEREFLFHDPKMLVGECWPYALVHSGTGDVTDALREILATINPDEPGTLTACIVAALQPALGNPWGMVQRVLVASYEGRPRLTLFTTEEIGGYPALHPVPIRTYMVSSASKAIDREVAKGLTPDTMTRVIRQQHAESHLEGHWPLAGKVQRARVSRDGVELVQVDELPDPMAVADERIRNG